MKKALKSRSWKRRKSGPFSPVLVMRMVRREPASMQSNGKPFVIAALRRMNLKAEYSDCENYKEIFAIIDALTDKDMELLADRMMHEYIMRLYSGSLRGHFEHLHLGMRFRSLNRRI